MLYPSVSRVPFLKHFLRYLQTSRPAHSTWGDTEALLCGPLDTSCKSLWSHLMWIAWRCQSPHNLPHQSANSSCNNPIVQLVVGFCIVKTSGHVERLSTTMRYFMLSTGTAKSTWILCHGWSVFGHGLHVVVGDFAASVHPLKRFYHVCYVPVHIWPIYIAAHETFRMVLPRMSHVKIHEDFSL